MIVSKEQSQPEIVADLRLLKILEAWFWDYDHFNTKGFEQVTYMGVPQTQGPVGGSFLVSRSTSRKQSPTLGQTSSEVPSFRLICLWL